MECERKKDEDLGSSSGRNGIFFVLRSREWERNRFEVGSLEFGLDKLGFRSLIVF